MELENNKPIAVLGGVDSGKTNLSIYLARNSGYDKKYLFGYPKKIEGFENICDTRALSQISKCVVVIDELDEIIPLSSRRSADELKSFLRFIAHNDVKVIFNTQLSQSITKQISALISCWAVTQMDIHDLKNGSKIKRILTRDLKIPEVINRRIGMRLKVGGFVWFDETSDKNSNGVYTFEFQGVGKDWKNV